jgi:hypothetical protein
VSLAKQPRSVEASGTEAGALILIKAAPPLRPLDFAKVLIQRPGEQAGILINAPRP